MVRQERTGRISRERKEEKKESRPTGGGRETLKRSDIQYRVKANKPCGRI